MSREWLFDTNVFSRYEQQFQHLRRGKLVLSSVVAQELLVGMDEKHRRKLRTLVSILKESGLVLTPSHDDWVEVGERLHRWFTGGFSANQKLSKEEVNLLVRDSLIAQCAITRNRLHRQNGTHFECVIVTDNISDFHKVTKGTHQKVIPGRDFFGE